MSIDVTTATFEPVTSTIGAVMSGVQLSPDLPQETIDQIAAGLREHGVLFFYDQPQMADPAVHEAFGARFGPPDLHPVSPTPLVVLDSDAYDASFDRSTGWHTDGSFEPTPPQTAILLPIVLPTVGGDTSWASMQSVYESLSSKYQRFLDGLTALHRLTLDLADKMGAETDPTMMDAYSAVHPVVTTDPITKRKGIYVNSNYTINIVELSDRESQSVLSFIYDQIKSPAHQVRFRWQPHSVAMWNERITQHFGVGRYEGRRLLHRVIACGDAPA